mmetsp:Transcript_38232/g.67435  ORF Transcript_38232/g.67435 Transcript_38232/m.67435 type:complete len:201 (+) Transcript_38232:45-647(+)
MMHAPPMCTSCHIGQTTALPTQCPKIGVGSTSMPTTRGRPSSSAFTSSTAIELSSSPDANLSKDTNANLISFTLFSRSVRSQSCSFKTFFSSSTLFNAVFSTVLLRANSACAFFFSSFASSFFSLATSTMEKAPKCSLLTFTNSTLSAFSLASTSCFFASSTLWRPCMVSPSKAPRSAGIFFNAPGAAATSAGSAPMFSR